MDRISKLQKVCDQYNAGQSLCFFLLDVFDVFPWDTKFGSSQVIWPFLMDKMLPKIYVDALKVVVPKPLLHKILCDFQIFLTSKIDLGISWKRHNLV